MIGECAAQAIEQLEGGKIRGIASALTLLEPTMKALQLGRQDVADTYETLLPAELVGKLSCR